MAAASRERDLLAQLGAAQSKLQPLKLRVDRLTQENQQLLSQVRQAESDAAAKVSSGYIPVRNSHAHAAIAHNTSMMTVHRQSWQLALDVS